MEPLSRSSLADFVIFWLIVVVAYCVVAYLRGQQAIRGGLEWLRQDDFREA